MLFPFDGLRGCSLSGGASLSAQFNLTQSLIRTTSTHDLESLELSHVMETVDFGHTFQWTDFLIAI